MSLNALSADEHQKIVDAESRYGNYYVNAHNATMMLSNMMLWPIIDCDLFIRFLSQMKKYHTLSLISTVRLHRIQAKMDLRYFLESTVHAAYSLVHTDTKIYFDHENVEQPNAKKASGKVYSWIKSAYNDHSQAISRIKNQINEQTAHANVFNSQHNFLYVPGESAEIHTSYFDFEDDEWVKADIWQCANAGLIAIDLLLAVKKKSGGFFPSSHVDGLADLIADNDALFQKLNAGRRSGDECR